MLDSAQLTRKPKLLRGTTTDSRPVDLHTVLKVPKSYLSTRLYQVCMCVYVCRLCVSVWVSFCTASPPQWTWKSYLSTRLYQVCTPACVCMCIDLCMSVWVSAAPVEYVPLVLKCYCVALVFIFLFAYMYVIFSGECLQPSATPAVSALCADVLLNRFPRARGAHCGMYSHPFPSSIPSTTSIRTSFIVMILVKHATHSPLLTAHTLRRCPTQ